MTFISCFYKQSVDDQPLDMNDRMNLEYRKWIAKLHNLTIKNGSRSRTIFFRLLKQQQKSDTPTFCSFALYCCKNLTQFSVLPDNGALKEESSFLLNFPLLNSSPWGQTNLYLYIFSILYLFSSSLAELKQIQKQINEKCNYRFLSQKGELGIIWFCLGWS